MHNEGLTYGHGVAGINFKGLKHMQPSIFPSSVTYNTRLAFPYISTYWLLRRFVPEHDLGNPLYLPPELLKTPKRWCVSIPSNGLNVSGYSIQLLKG